MRKLQERFKEGSAEERVKRELKAFNDSKPIDEFVTVAIVGSGELEKMTRADWDLVIETKASDYSFLDECLVRKGCDELARALGIDN